MRLRPLVPGRRRARSCPRERRWAAAATACPGQARVATCSSSLPSPRTPFRIARVSAAAARRRRRLRAGGVLRRGGAPRERRPARRGRHDRAAADALGARPARRRARPPEHQDRLAGVREDRGAAGLPLPRQRRGRRDVTHEELAELYDAVVYAVGAQTDRRLGIPARTCPGRGPPPAFVAWYNGHPDFQHLEFDLSHERAVVIGNGNVALDVARMLALTPEELAPTDTTDAAIEAINAAGVEGDPRPRAPRAGAGRLDAPSRSGSSASWPAPTSSSIRPSSSSTPRARPSSRPRRP